MTLPRGSLSKMIKGLYRYGVQPTIVSGCFEIGAAATFYETQHGGQGSIVARTGAGLYLVTMDDRDIVDVYSATACVQDTAGAHTDLIARAEDITIGAVIVPTTIAIEAYAAAVATDVLSANNLLCHYQIVYSRGWAGEPDQNPVGFHHHVTDAVMIAGGVDIGAVGAVGLHHGEGFTLARTGAGDYLLTFDDAFNQILGGNVNAGNAAGVGGDLSANFGTFTPGAAGAASLQIGTQVAAVSTDPANGGRINFCVYLGGEASGS